MPSTNSMNSVQYYPNYHQLTKYKNEGDIYPTDNSNPTISSSNSGKSNKNNSYNL